MIPPKTLRRNLVVLAMDFHTPLGWLYAAPLAEIRELLGIHEEMTKEAEKDGV